MSADTVMTPADLTVLKLAVNGHDVLWIAAATQTSTANVQAVLTAHGPTRDDWQQAIDGYEMRAFTLPEGRPDQAHVVRNDLRDQPQPPRLAIVPPSPEPAMTADATPEHDPRCGEVLSGGGAPRGWVLIRIVGQGTPRRYCSTDCAIESRVVARQEVVEVVAPSAAPAPLPPGRQRATSALRVGADQQWRDLLAALGTTAADVRVWCADNGITMPPRGPVPAHVRAAYAAAHTTTGAQTA